MFRRTVAATSPEELQSRLAPVLRSLDRSHLPMETVALVREQLESTMDQFRRHSVSSRVQRYNADRVFEGDGFKVVVKIRGGRSPGLLGKFQRMVGLR